MLKRFSVHWALIVTLFLPAWGSAADLYRYVDNNGIVVLNRLGVPPEYVAKGYEVLNDKGRVIKVIPPAPSLEERQRMSDEKARASSDNQLLRFYSTVEDVDRARERKLVELDGVISVTQSNLQSLRVQQGNLQAQAATIERSGREVSTDLLAQIDNIKAEQVGLEKDILRYQEVRKQADAAFVADRERLRALLNR